MHSIFTANQGLTPQPEWNNHENFDKDFHSVSAISFLFLSAGTVLMISTSTSGGKATATGSAPGEMDFEASAFQCYDIYADDSDISIELGNFSYDGLLHQP